MAVVGRKPNASMSPGPSRWNVAHPDELRRRYVEFDEVPASAWGRPTGTEGCELSSGEGVSRSPRLLRERALHAAGNEVAAVVTRSHPAPRCPLLVVTTDIERLCRKDCS